MRHERDEIARQPLPRPRGHAHRDLMLYWTKTETATGPPKESIVFEVVHLTRRYLHHPDGHEEVIWYEPKDNYR